MLWASLPLFRWSPWLLRIWAGPWDHYVLRAAIPCNQSPKLVHRTACTELPQSPKPHEDFESRSSVYSSVHLHNRVYMPRKKSKNLHCVQGFRPLGFSTSPS